MPIINGTTGNDNGSGAPALIGTDQDDTINGLAGDDLINGAGGVDFLFGDDGADSIDGGTGNDLLDGGLGNDSLTDSDGSNTFNGGDGNDSIVSTSVSIGQSISGGAGNDSIQLLAGGSSTINGGSGIDSILLSNVSGVIVTGGADSDTFVFQGGTFSNTITDFAAGAGGDVIRVMPGQLINYSGGNPFSTGHLRLVQSGNDIQVQIDRDGAQGSEVFVTLAILQNVISSTLTTSNFDGYSPFTPLGADPRNDFNGDGRSDILWRHDTGLLTEWLGQANGGFVDNGANAFANIATTWSVTGTGDFNGDGRDDILWRHDAGHLTEWLGQANGGFVDNGANAFATIGTSWSVTGTGDFNGDGRDDILWRHDTGLLTEWLGQANGSFADNGANAFANIATTWSVAGTGDFNGDGRDDILWRHDTGHLTEWLGQANGGFVDNGANAFATIGTSWSVTGIGDFNGDGRDDILWRHDTGLLTEWLGQENGGFADNGANAFANIATSWTVASIGDFNGDGRDDVLWRHETGHLTEWLGQANGGFVDNGANAFATIGTSWQIQPESPFI